MLSVDNSHNKIIWAHLGRSDNRFWVLCYLEGSTYQPIVAEASKVIQEAYIDPDESIPEDLLTVFTSSDAALLYIAAISRQIGAEHNDNLRFVSMSQKQLMDFLASLDRRYQARQTALRVDICELKNRDLRREILFSRQIPKH